MTRQALLTGTRIQVRGIYQSTCGCRTALTLMIDDSLPRCLGCDDAVEWHLVQEVRASVRPASSSQLRAVTPPTPPVGGQKASGQK